MGRKRSGIALPFLRDRFIPRGRMPDLLLCPFGLGMEDFKVSHPVTIDQQETGTYACETLDCIQNSPVTLLELE